MSYHTDFIKLNPKIVEEEGSVGEHVDEIVHVDLDEANTLVNEEIGEQGVKKVDIELVDSDDEAGAMDSGNECGVGRKRTIRVIIRSRAFL